MSWTSQWRTGTQYTGTTLFQSIKKQTKQYFTKLDPRLGVDGAVCYTCNLNIMIKPTLMEIVQVGHCKEENDINLDSGLESRAARTSGVGLQRSYLGGSGGNGHNADAPRGCKSTRNPGGT